MKQNYLHTALHKFYITHSMRFFIFLVFLGFSGFVHSAFPDKFQVCTITLNSEDEARIFKSYLPSSRFNFIELSEKPSHQDSYNKDRWFSSVCQREGLQCDILIISGHFAGVFFGKNTSRILSVSEMERMACQEQCPRVFEYLKEVFLFGCNTMAGKDLIYRSPEEYLDVLVRENNIPQDAAERIVAFRYSALDPTFRDKMEHIFHPWTRIYGFKEISPYGHQARGPLRRYLSQIQSQYGGYYNYLIHHFYKGLNVRTPSYFLEAFNPISLAHQSRGMSKSHVRYSAYQKLCSIYSEQLSSEEKMQAVYRLMQEGEALFAFSTIKQFLVQNKSRFNSRTQRWFQKMKDMRNVEVQFRSIYSKLNSNLSYIKAKFLHFLRMMEWVDSLSYRKELRRQLLPRLQRSTLESFDILNALVQEDGLKASNISVQYSDFGSGYLKNIWGVLIVDELNISHTSMQKDLIRYCLNKLESSENSLVDCYQVFKTLGHLKASDPDVLEVMSEFLESSEPGLVFYATYGLAYSGVQDARIQFKIVQNLVHPNERIRFQTLKSLDYLGLIESSQELRERIEYLIFNEWKEGSKVSLEARSILESL